MTLPEVRTHGEITDYEPEKGLQSVALYEAAETYFRRAKDVDSLFQAVEGKLTEQRNFVLWWDGQSGHPTGRPKASQVHDALPTAKSLGLDRDTVLRWR